MAQTPAERMRAYRARNGAQTRAEVQPCGTRAAVARHQRNPGKWGELSGCATCSSAEARRQADLRSRRLQ